MNFNRLKEKLFSFWFLQTFGWTINWFVHNLSSFLYWKRLAPEVVLWNFLVNLQGFTISLLLRYIYKRINYEKKTVFKLASIGLLCSVLCSNIWYFADILLDQFMRWTGYEILAYTIQNYMRQVFTNSWIFVCWSAFYFIIKIWREWENQKTKTNNAVFRANQKQLQMLRYQLNPHFLFNSLSSIRALIDEDEQASKQMVTELSEFLRYSFLNRNNLNVPLYDEIEAVRHYLAIEKKRFEDKLEVHIEVEPEAETYPVLNFLIHPIVENAVKYGMKTSPLPLKVWIKAKVSNGILIIDICNTGKWIKPSMESISNHTGTGTGISNVEQRLENAFSGKYKFSTFENEHGVHVQVELDGRDFQKTANDY
jgi:two-component system, LytTR family, sensor kinase